MRFLNGMVVAMLAPTAFAQHPVAQIKVTGNERLPAAAVIAASGLRVGQTATHADLDRAAQKLADTGLFSSVSYQYDPKTVGGVTGYAITLQVSEAPAHTAVELDLPGQDPERLWQQLKAADALIDKQMPSNDRASDYYKRAIERVLRKSNDTEEIVMKTEADLNSGRMMVVCRPAHSPKVTAIRFEGNAAIGAGALVAAMTRVAIGQDYSERDFRRMLELNVRPLYEELGRLTVAFPRVSMTGAGDGAVTVTAGVDEGPVWNLGKVALAGDTLPLADMHDAARFASGSPANWKQFLESVKKMEQVLRRDGYIKADAKPVRSFRESERIVDVSVEVKKGPQFVFGELHIEGLDAGTRERLAELWKLPGGAPMNALYVDDFFRAVMPSLRGKVKSVGSELHIRSGTHVADVTLKFR
jgi:outer membrane protein assembly factor BamA